MTCHHFGANRLRVELTESLRAANVLVETPPEVAQGTSPPNPIRSQADGRLRCEVRGVSCLGRCDRAPVAVVTHYPNTRQPPPSGLTGTVEQLSHPERRLLVKVTPDKLRSACGPVLPEADLDSRQPIDTRSWTIDPYNGTPDFRALRNFKAVFTGLALSFRPETAACGFAFLPGGRCISVTTTGAIQRWEARRPTEVDERCPLRDVSEILTFRVAENWLALFTSGSQVELWSLSPLERKIVLSAPDGVPETLAFDPKGPRLTWGTRAGELHSLDLKSQRPEMIPLDAELSALAWSNADPQGTRAALGTADGALVLIGGKLAQKAVAAHAQGVAVIVFGPRGKTVVTAGRRDTEIKVWDSASGDLRTSLLGHTGPVTSLAVHPSLPFLVSGSEDGTVKFWDLKSGDQKLSVAANGPVRAVDFDHNGRYFGVLTAAGIRIWYVPLAEFVLGELEVANLRGMGGAMVPVFSKWSDVRKQRHPEKNEKYVIANGDESEPATFKDRELMLRTPWLIVESVILAGHVVGAREGYIYVRHEYEEQVQRLEAAIQEAARQRHCGPDSHSTAWPFDLQVFVSPGGYICGEQSALIEAIEDHRAEPRNKPPEITSNGLFDCPTVVNNVETLAWVPSILLYGGEYYANQEVLGCKGRRFFSVSGDVNFPGVYEVPIGITLREFLERYADRAPRDKPFKAIALSGPSGGFFPTRIPLDWFKRGSLSGRETLQRQAERNPTLQRFLAANLSAETSELDLLDLCLDIDLIRTLGLMLGAGIAVFKHGTNMVEQALHGVEFFRNESCGKCVPCRLGTAKLALILRDLVDRKYTAETWAAQYRAVRELTDAMRLTSICSLGNLAMEPLRTLEEFFPEDIQRFFQS